MSAEPGHTAWRVRIPAHQILRRTIGGVASEHDPYEVAGSERFVYGGDRRYAIRTAVRSAHIDAGIPQWKPYLRQTAKLVQVTRVHVSVLSGVVEDD